ncbi:MAG TPA: hypothetical protein VLV83_27415 [Acidobacteriota bacterium]|nr:hypothetical protein [Acidobacteriota bacterium]
MILATGIVLGIIRACCLALGSHFLTTTADYRQAIGYFMAMLSLPELTLVSSLRGDYEIWIVSGGLSVVAGSALWALILAGGLNLYDAVRSPARSDNS